MHISSVEGKGKIFRWAVGQPLWLYWNTFHKEKRKTSTLNHTQQYGDMLQKVDHIITELNENTKTTNSSNNLETPFLYMAITKRHSKGERGYRTIHWDKAH